jgi:DNA-binding CsgD family transcriptional regulator/putative methionine-R-sulfoxide reductase with GAF domain
MKPGNAATKGDRLANELADMRQLILELKNFITENKHTEQDIRNGMNIHSAIWSILHFCVGDESQDEILKYALHLILSMPSFALVSRGCIFVADADGENLIMKVQTGLPDSLKKKCRRVPIGKCLCGRAALLQKMQFADCLHVRHEIEYEGIAAYGHYCVPLVYAGKTLGVINAYVREGHRPDRAEEEFLAAMASAITWALECRRTKMTLNEKESRISMIMSGFEGFFYVASSQYIIEFMNGKSIKRTGYEATGEVCYKAMHRRDSPCPSCDMDRVLKGEIFRWETKDAEDNRWYYVVNSPLHHSDGSVSKQSVILDITEIKEVEESLLEAERTLRARTEELVESNTTLKYLIKKMEEGKKDFEGRVLSHVKNMILPYIVKLRKTDCISEASIYLDIIESNLKEIISSISSERTSELVGLTAKEMEIAKLIKEGKETAEMAKALNMSAETIKSHRQNIRKKLGVSDRKANLRTFLLSNMK